MEFYKTLNPKEKLYSGPMILFSRAKMGKVAPNSPGVFFGDGEIQLKWEPNPFYYISLTLHNSNNLIEFHNEYFRSQHFLLVTDNMKFKICRLNFLDMSTSKIEGFVVCDEERDTDSLKSIEFYLGNFIEIPGKMLTTKKIIYPGLTEFTYKDLKVDIIRSSNNQKIKDAKLGTSFYLSHKVTITPVKGNYLKGRQYLTLRKYLYYFFSFLQKDWTPFVLEKNVSTSPKVDTFSFAAEKDSIGRATHYARACKYEWLTEDIIVEYFNNYTSVLDNTSFSTDLFRAIKLYISACCDHDEETSILTVQSALELLSWLYFVEFKKVYDRNTFDSLNASHKIRILMNELNIAYDKTPNLPGIKEFKSKNKSYEHKHYIDIIVEVRNSLTHPNKKDKFKSYIYVIEETSLYYKWLLEIVIGAFLFGEYNYKYISEGGHPASFNKTPRIIAFLTN